MPFDLRSDPLFDCIHLTELDTITQMLSFNSSAARLSALLCVCLINYKISKNYKKVQEYCKKHDFAGHKGQKSL